MDDCIREDGFFRERAVRRHKRDGGLPQRRTASSGKGLSGGTETGTVAPDGDSFFERRAAGK